MVSNYIIAGCVVAGISLVAVYMFYKKSKEYQSRSEVSMLISEIPLEEDKISRQETIRLPNGEEMVRKGDIALSPGFGVGEGTFGFGRFGSSFMA